MTGTDREFCFTETINVSLGEVEIHQSLSVYYNFSEIIQSVC
jgi:hypothetical protein